MEDIVEAYGTKVTKWKKDNDMSGHCYECHVHFPEDTYRDNCCCCSTHMNHGGHFIDVKEPNGR